MFNYNKVLISILIIFASLGSIDSKPSNDNLNSNTIENEVAIKESRVASVVDFDDNVVTGDTIPASQINLTNLSEFEIAKFEGGTYTTDSNGFYIVNNDPALNGGKVFFWLSPAFVVDTQQPFTLKVTLDRLIEVTGVYGNQTELTPADPGAGWMFYGNADANNTSIFALKYKFDSVLKVAQSYSNFNRTSWGDTYEVSYDYGTNVLNQKSCFLDTAYGKAGCEPTDANYNTVNISLTSTEQSKIALYDILGIYLGETNSYSGAGSFGDYQIKDMKFSGYIAEYEEIRVLNDNAVLVTNSTLDDVANLHNAKYYFFNKNAAFPGQFYFEEVSNVTGSAIANSTEIDLTTAGQYDVEYYFKNAGAKIGGKGLGSITVIDEAVFENDSVNISNAPTSEIEIFNLLYRSGNNTDGQALTSTNFTVTDFGGYDINNPAQGEYTLTFDIDYSNGQNRSITKTIYVLDENTVDGSDTILTAIDFVITQSLAGTATESDIITQANATAKLISDGSVLNVNVDPTDLATINQAVIGKYPITLIADSSDNLEKDIFVTIVSDMSVIGENYYLTADDFTIDISQVSSVTDTQLLGQNYTNAIATKISDETAGSPTITTNNLASSLGSYKLSVAVTEEMTVIKEVTGTVVDQDTVVGTDYALSAQNFQIDLSQVGAYTDTDNSDIISDANATAWNLNDNTQATVNVLSNGIIAQEGVYPVELAANASAITKTIYVTVTGPNGVLTGDLEHLLTADNFTVDLTNGDVLPTTIEEFVNLANAKITSTSDGTQITDYTDLTTNPVSMAGYEDGTYNVTFTLNNQSGEAIVNVVANVLDENSGVGTIDGASYAVVANDFVIDKRAGSGYISTDYNSSAKIATLANAGAINTSTSQIDPTKTIVTNPSTFETNLAGIYETAYTIDTTTISAVANVFVIDDTSTVGSDGVVINGNNFTITDQVALTLTNNDVIVNGMINAFNDSTAEIYPVTVNTTDLAVLNAGMVGVYPVKLMVDNSTTSKTIYVTITGEDGVLTGNSEYLLTANNFTVDLTAGNTLPTTNEEFVSLANAKITSSIDGTQITDYANLTTDPSTLAGYTDGLYDVEFTLTSQEGNSTVNVNAVVIDENSGAGEIDGENYAVVANDFVIDKRTNSVYISTDYDSSVKIADLANASAININTAQKDLTKTIVTSPDTFVNNPAGVYETTYTIDTTNINAIANVFVIDDTSTVGSDGVVINASNFVISSQEAAIISNETVITNGIITAFNETTAEVFSTNINPIDLAVIKTGTVGVYPLELTVDNSTTSKVIYVTVIDEETVISEDSEYVLSAYDFVIDLTAGDTLPTTIEEFVNYANLKIFNSIGEIITDYSTLSTNPASLAGANPGVAAITFTFVKDGSTIEKTVSVNIIDTPEEFSYSTYKLQGKEAVININDLASANLAEEFELEVAIETQGDREKVYDLNQAVYTPTITDLEVGLHFIDIALDDLNITLPLVITNDNTVVDNGKVLFIDKNFIQLNKDQATTITFENLLEFTNARAYVIETGESITIQTLTPEKLVQISSGTPGTYEIIIKANPEATITVEVTSESLTGTGNINYRVILALMLALLIVVKSTKFVKSKN